MPVRELADSNPYDPNARRWKHSSRKKPAPEKPRHQTPAAGPHDKPDLTDEERTPGAGTLPKPGAADDDDMAPTG